MLHHGWRPGAGCDVSPAEKRALVFRETVGDERNIPFSFLLLERGKK
jgi:hypothetical protein